jgi:hypothetical protein
MKKSKKNFSIEILMSGRMESSSLNNLMGGLDNSCPSNYKQSCSPTYCVLCTWFTHCTGTPTDPGFQLCYDDSFKMCSDYKLNV